MYNNIEIAVERVSVCVCVSLSVKLSVSYGNLERVGGLNWMGGEGWGKAHRRSHVTRPSCTLPDGLDR